MRAEREQILVLIDEAMDAGARQGPCCKVLGLDERTVQRWRYQDVGEDDRCGPRSEPANKLTAAERRRILEVANSPEFRDLSPKQIVPRLAEQGRYVASESSFYRVLRQQEQLRHRSPAKPATRSKPREYTADGPCQVLSWDITYLRGPVRGTFYYLYLILDVWSRMILGWAVHEEESMELSAELVEEIAGRFDIDLQGSVLHSDNGSPMKGSTMLATLQRLGVVPSFSRPSTSNDNAYSESLFRTLKYRPEYPQQAFGSLEEARTWVDGFVGWYNQEHRHSAIGFVTPQQRHTHADVAILERRKHVYEAARGRHPHRWSGGIRNWERIQCVRLNPQRAQEADARRAEIAA